MTISERELQGWIIKKLVRHRYWGKAHISEDNLAKGKPPQVKKQIIKVARELVREGLLVMFPHGAEHHYYLNPNQRKKIYEIVERL